MDKNKKRSVSRSLPGGTVRISSEKKDSTLPKVKQEWLRTIMFVPILALVTRQIKIFASFPKASS